MIDQRFRCVPAFRQEPQDIQDGMAEVGKVLLRDFTDHWLFVALQDGGYRVLVIKNGMPLTLPCAVYEVTVRFLEGMLDVKKVF